MPLMLGVLAVQMKDVIFHTDNRNAAMLLLAFVLITLLIPQFRRYTLMLICFGVCVFSLNRIWEGLREVDWLLAVWTDYAFVLMWLGIGLFSLAAGIGEVWYDGPRWAQQSYLIAVSLYFTGHGGSAFLQDKYLLAVFFVLVGLVALGGVLWIQASISPAPVAPTQKTRRGINWVHSSSAAEELPSRDQAT